MKIVRQFLTSHADRFIRLFAASLVGTLVALNGPLSTKAIIAAAVGAFEVAYKAITSQSPVPPPPSAPSGPAVPATPPPAPVVPPVVSVEPVSAVVSAPLSPPPVLAPLTPPAV